MKAPLGGDQLKNEDEKGLRDGLLYFVTVTMIVTV